MSKIKYKGLTESEVIKSRIEYGTNEIEAKKKESILQKIVHLFCEPMFLLLLITASIYFFLGEITDGIIMLCFVLFISGIEFVQEQKTDNALEELNKLTSLNTRVIRDGKVNLVNSKDLVVGDIVLLEEGDKIAADGIILESGSLGVNESSLTGETEVVYKSLREKNNSLLRSDMCYAGCDVVNGSAVIKITNVGINTEYGKIGASLKTIKKDKTPLEREVNKLIKYCSIFSFILLILTMVFNFINNAGLPMDERITESILSGITIAMATIPEEIPVVLTVFLAMGAWDLARYHTLTKNMKTVETLGAVTVLCTDKTGTLTENKMSVEKVLSSDKDFLQVTRLACSKEPFDPMEIAIVEYSKNNNLKLKNAEPIYEYAFNNKDKIMGLVYDMDGTNLLCVKGAYESVLSLCDLKEEEKMEIEKRANDFSKDGYRIIAVAKNTNLKSIPKTLSDVTCEFVGLIALDDNIRKGVKTSLESAYDAGVKVIMITGDNGETAKGIAKKIGLKSYENVITGEDLEKMSDDELKEAVKQTNIFARVYPNHKLRIVNALEANGEIVAMTGDGINDAPALKKAEIGIAMGQRGTNIAKEAADMILMDDNFSTIVTAIKNGRSIYSNIKKAIEYILIIHIPIALSALITPLLNIPTLFLPVHIVLLELIIDPTSSIIFERIKINKNIMKEKPRKIDETLINRKNFAKCVFQGLFIFVACLGSYYYLIKSGISEAYARTFAFSILVISNILLIYVLKSNECALKNFKDELSDNVICFINAIILIVLLLLIYVPFLSELAGFSALSLIDLLKVVCISVFSTCIFDLIKLHK